MSAMEIAKLYNLNIRVLVGVLRRLSQRRILFSKREDLIPRYIFGRDPHTISLYEIIAALEGEYHFLRCRQLIPGLRCGCADSEVNRADCLIYRVIGESLEEITDRLKSTYIGEIIES